MQAAQPVGSASSPGVRLPGRTPANGRKPAAARVSNAGKRAARYLADHRLVLVTAESASNGLIAERLTGAAGVAGVLERSFIVETQEATEKDLGVRPSTIERFKLTSEEVALEMARGALARSDAGIAIASTAIAGDHAEGNPAVQCFAWVYRTGPLTQQAFTETRVFHSPGTEGRIAAADHALDSMVDHHRTMLR